MQIESDKIIFGNKQYHIVSVINESLIASL